MSATNATTNYSLPLFIGTDKPAWLVDWNTAMTDIDAQMKVNATAILANETAISGLSTTVSAHTTSISTISGQITTLTTGLNTAQGNINTINSLIGNGTPTTTDQTLIGAINELHANQGSLASLQTTDKTSLVAAINEIVGGSGTGVAASAVSYDNTTSGLTATDVQAAIDELANQGTAGRSLKATIDHSTNTTMGAMAAAIKTAFDSLSADEQKNAIVICGIYVYQLTGPEGRFCCTEISAGALAINAFYPTTFLTLRGTTYADASSTASESDAYIYA